MRQRLDKAIVDRGLTQSRSQALSYIKLGEVFVNGAVSTKAGQLVGKNDTIDLRVEERYVSRAGLKLASVARSFDLKFDNQVVLDIGSSTGGFTDYALRHGARRVIAVDVGSNQLHASLRSDPRVDLHEKTDIRDFRLELSDRPGLVLIDVSFISLKKVLPTVVKYLSKKCIQNPSLIVAMVKPQFETTPGNLNKGVVKNNSIRRQILRDFELWAKRDFQILKKQDSSVAGEKGNLERFYLLRPKH